MIRGERKEGGLEIGDEKGKGRRWRKEIEDVRMEGREEREVRREREEREHEK